MSPLLIREQSLLATSSDEGLDPKSFLTPLHSVPSVSSVSNQDYQLNQAQSQPLFTITPLVDLDQPQNQEPDSTTTFDSGTI